MTNTPRSNTVTVGVAARARSSAGWFALFHVQGQAHIGDFEREGGIVYDFDGTVVLGQREGRFFALCFFVEIGGVDVWGGNQNVLRFYVAMDDVLVVHVF